MTIPLTTSGGLFTRLGHWIGGLDDINALIGGAATARVLSGADWITRIAQLQTDYAASPQDSYILNNIYSALSTLQNQGGFTNQLATYCRNTVVEMANNDTPLASPQLSLALQLLISQMTGVASVQASVVSAGTQTAVGTPNGNPVIVASTKRGDGLVNEYAIAETLTFLCTNDAQSGGATLNQEPLSIKGTIAANPLAYNWPLGSNYSGSQNCVDATQDYPAGGNLLRNSDFESWTVPNVPDRWVVQVGTPGTTILEATSQAYSGTHCLQYVGNGSQLTQITQDFNSTTGTGYRLKPLTQYAWNCFLRVDSSAPAVGVLQVALVDNLLTVINDQQGLANVATVSLPGRTGTYASFSGVFRTPAVLPNSNVGLKFSLALTTALSNAKNMFFDHLALTEMKGTYPGGLSFSSFSADTPLIVGDSWKFVATNTLGLFQKAFQRLFDMRTLGLILPSSGSPTISDSLIA